MRVPSRGPPRDIRIVSMSPSINACQTPSRTDGDAAANIVNSTFGEKEYNLNMAATILTALLPLVVYFGSGRWFVRGIAAGAVKG